MGSCREEGERDEIQAAVLPQGHAALLSCPVANLGHGKEGKEKFRRKNLHTQAQTNTLPLTPNLC